MSDIGEFSDNFGWRASPAILGVFHRDQGFANREALMYFDISSIFSQAQNICNFPDGKVLSRLLLPSGLSEDVAAISTNETKQTAVTLCVRRCAPRLTMKHASQGGSSHPRHLDPFLDVDLQALPGTFIPRRCPLPNNRLLLATQ